LINVNWPHSENREVDIEELGDNLEELTRTVFKAAEPHKAR
jgi:hypothetical protein